MGKAKYCQSRAIKQKLWRNGIRNAEMLATFLLDLVFEMSMKFGSRDYENSRYEIEGLDYRAFVDQLVEGGWIKRIPKHRIVKPEDHFRFELGQKLIPYVNREKAHRAEVASIEDLYSFGEELRGQMRGEFVTKEQMEKRFAEMFEERIDELIELLNPPSTEEKRRRVRLWMRKKIGLRAL